MAFTGFRGTANGSVQSAYTDQPGVAIAGQLAFASDYNLVDSALIGTVEGIPAGYGVQLVLNTGTEPGNFQVPNRIAQLPNATALTIADFGGVLVFDEGCQSDGDGVPGWGYQRNGRVLRSIRAGGRIYVKVNVLDTVAVGNNVFWVISAGTDGKYAAGSFTNAALAGTALAGYSVAITSAKFVTAGAAGGIAMIEFNG